MKLLSFVLSLNMLVSTTGINLHSHICLQQDAESGALIAQDCHSNSAEAKCCVSEKACGSEEDSCCTIQDNFVKEDLDARISETNDVTTLQAQMPTHIISTFDSHQSSLSAVVPPSDKYAVLADRTVLQVFRC